MTGMTPSARFVRLWMAALIAIGGIVGAPDRFAAAAPLTSNGFTTSVRMSAAQFPPGATVTATATVTAQRSRHALVDLEVYDPTGRRVLQRFWDRQRFTAGAARSFAATWTLATNAASGRYVVKVGVFSSGWGTLSHWNDTATTFDVTTVSTTSTTSTTTTTTAGPPATTTTTTTIVSSTTTVPSAGRFETLPPGSALPSSAQCAGRVRRAPEVRSMNVTFNATRGHAYTPSYPFADAELRRVDGNFAGSTDEILQWAACKWGIDEDVVRAQMAKESWWDQRNLGDWWSYPADACPPGHAPGEDGRPGECPQSIGIGQVRYSTGDQAFPAVEESTAMNVDVAYAIWRACFEGKEYWLNDVERGRQYQAGDMWGCVGRWFAGRWYTTAANGYITAVQDYLARRIWTNPDFLGYR